MSLLLLIKSHEQRHIEPSIKAHAYDPKNSTFVDFKALRHVTQHIWKGCGNPWPNLPNVRVGRSILAGIKLVSLLLNDLYVIKS